jgi:ParB family chromosome partitioning protein
VKEDKQTLGRSIADLLEENLLDEATNEQIIELEIDQIIPNKEQPRTLFPEETLNELAESIKEHGLLQPIIIKPSGNNRYMLVAGERRLRAAKIAGLHKIPVLIRDYNAKYVPILALMENVQREDLTPIEEAIALQTVIDKLQLTHEELGNKIGKSRVYVTNMLGLLSLPRTVMESVNHGIVSMGHARALSKLSSKEQILRLHDRIITEHLTVRELESIIRNVNKKEGSAISNTTLQRAESKLKQYLPKDIKFKLTKTQMSFKYDNEEELEELLSLLKGEK